MHSLRSKEIILLLSFVLAGCNQHLKPYKILSIDPQLQPYFYSFLKDAADLGHPILVDNLSMHFVTNLIPSSHQGVCEKNKNPPRILISLQYWQSFQEIEKKALVYHELGHCVLGLEHDNEYICFSEYNECIPRSLMYPYSISAWFYSKYWNYYASELFNGPT